MKDLIKIINSMPTQEIHLYGNDKKEPAANNLPLSDHDIIVGTNQHGTFATWNILNPDSPVSPGFAPKELEGIRWLENKEEKIKHIELAAQVVIDLFKNGVDALALQEIPDRSKISDGESYFNRFVNELKRLALDNKIELDFDSFDKSYLLTDRPLKDGKEAGTHNFATGLLFRNGAFTLNSTCKYSYFLNSDTPCFIGRGSIYQIKSNATNENLVIVNTHGDYGQADNLAQSIALHLKNPNTIVLGDTNIPLTKANALKIMSNLCGVVIEPSTNLAGTPEDKRTIDCFVTNILTTTYLYKNTCTNLIKSSDYTPGLFHNTHKDILSSDNKTSHSQEFRI